MQTEIINKVASSGLVTIDLEEYYPKGIRKQLDLKDILFQGLILLEKDLKEYISNTNFGDFKDAYVNIFCSADAVIPTWAYMLLTVHLQPYATKIVYGNAEQLEAVLFDEILQKLDAEKYTDAKIVIKGCGNLPVPIHAYVAFTEKLKPYAKSIMYGEPCSTVPLYKKPKM